MRWSLPILVASLLSTAACSSSPESKVGDATGGRSTGGASSSNAAGAAGEAGSGGSAGQSTVTDFKGAFGRRCDEVTPCQSELTCFAAKGSEFGELGPAGGLCSMRCATDSDCVPIDDTASTDNARCVALVVDDPSSTVCLPGCRIGDKTACGGRDELACWALEGSPTDGSGRACMPLCNHDGQCPAGTVCDGSVNLCAAWASSGGLALGDECDATVANPCDNGICLDFGSGGVCTSYCRRGTFPQCGGDGEDALCGWVFEGDEQVGVADAGMCAEACRCNTDCASGSYCLAIASRKDMDKPGICAIGSGTGIEQCP